MEKKILVSPRFEIKTRSFEIDNGFELEYYSNEKGDWCRVTIPSDVKKAVSCREMEEGQLYLGYGEESEELLRGYCSESIEGSGEIVIRDAFIKLERIVIKCTFVDVTVQDAIRFVLTQAGVENYNLSDENLGKKESIVIDRQDGIKALETISKAFQTDKNFYFRKGVFYWGIEEEQPDIFSLEENVNILAFNRYGNETEIETFGMPWIKRGDMVEIRHSAYSGEAKVRRVIIKKNVKGFTRMHIFI